MYYLLHFINHQIQKGIEMHITIEKDLNAPVEAIWHLFGERFAEIGQWADFLVGSSIDGPLQAGSTRTCNLKTPSAGSDIIQERITRFDRDKRELGYVITTGMPGFMRHVENNWTLQPLSGDRTRATSVLTVRTAWYAAPMRPMIRRQFSKLIEGFMKELETKSVPSYTEGKRAKGEPLLRTA